MSKKTFLVTGTAGTGKTTVLRKLSKQGISTIGIDEEAGLTTWVDKQTGEIAKPGVALTDSFLKTHDWGCNISQLRTLLDQIQRPVVICGSCDNVAEVIALCEASFVLVCEPEVFLPRIEQRTDNEYGKTETAKQQILGYYKAYRDECIHLGAAPVDASQPIETVVNEILENIK